MNKLSKCYECGKIYEEPTVHKCRQSDIRLYQAGRRDMFEELKRAEFYDLNCGPKSEEEYVCIPRDKFNEIKNTVRPF